MSEIQALRFMRYILKDRIAFDGKTIPVHIRLHEKIDLPFVLLQLTHNQRLPYNLTSYRPISDDDVERKLIRPHEYTILALIYAHTPRARDTILSKVIDLLLKADRGHYSLCLRYENGKCTTTGEECDARRLNADSPFLPCPFANIRDRNDPHFRDPVTPHKQFGIGYVGLGRWDYDIDADHKPPLYLAKQEVRVVVEESEREAAPRCKGVRLARA